jgi:hypothetical protein
MAALMLDVTQKIETLLIQFAAFIFSFFNLSLFIKKTKPNNIPVWHFCWFFFSLKVFEL